MFVTNCGSFAVVFNSLVWVSFVLYVTTVECWLWTGLCHCWLSMETRMRTGQNWSSKRWDIPTSVYARLASTCLMEHTTRMCHLSVCLSVCLSQSVPCRAFVCCFFSLDFCSCKPVFAVKIAALITLKRAPLMVMVMVVVIVLVVVMSWSCNSHVDTVMMIVLFL